MVAMGRLDADIAGGLRAASADVSSRRDSHTMPRTCTVCAHPELQAIDQALVASEPFRHIAARFDTSTGSLQRHRSDHLPVSLVKAHDAGEVAHGDDLLDQVRGLQGKALAILVKAEAAGDLRVALGAIREAGGCLELLAKLLGLMNDREPQRDQPVQVTRVTVVLPAGYGPEGTVVEGGVAQVGP